MGVNREKVWVIRILLFPFFFIWFSKFWNLALDIPKSIKKLVNLPGMHFYIKNVFLNFLLPDPPSSSEAGSDDSDLDYSATKGTMQFYEYMVKRFT